MLVGANKKAIFPYDFTESLGGSYLALASYSASFAHLIIYMENKR